jgi:pimeloyl-ACP methyl ester carboxylesterase
MKSIGVTEHFAKNAEGGGIFYLAAGPADGPLLIFLHGWPELSLSWRHQLPCFASLGFRAVAPDMPGYGRSTVYGTNECYAVESIVKNMIFLLDSLGADKAVWIGHDLGSPPVWAIASHHPDRCHAVASVGVPYRTVELGLEHLLLTVDREIYPESIYPNGQWDYMAFYRESFQEATRTFDSNPDALVRAMFTRGSPEGAGKPQFTADVRRRGGWFGAGGHPPELLLDEAILSVEELHQYASALRRNGFFGPDSYYMNDAANAEYGARAVNGGLIDMPVLFLLAEYDFFCECTRSSFADEMRRCCRNLTAVSISSGHWMAQEKPVELNAALAYWLASTAHIWPKLAPPRWRSLG